MAVVAEGHVVGLILDEQVRSSRSVGLMATEAAELNFDLALVGRIHDIRDGVAFNGVSEPVA